MKPNRPITSPALPNTLKDGVTVQPQITREQVKAELREALRMRTSHGTVAIRGMLVSAWRAFYRGLFQRD